MRGRRANKQPRWVLWGWLHAYSADLGHDRVAGVSDQRGFESHSVEDRVVGRWSLDVAPREEGSVYLGFCCKIRILTLTCLFRHNWRPAVLAIVSALYSSSAKTGRSQRSGDRTDTQFQNAGIDAEWMEYPPTDVTASITSPVKTPALVFVEKKCAAKSASACMAIKYRSM